MLIPTLFIIAASGVLLYGTLKLIGDIRTRKEVEGAVKRAKERGETYVIFNGVRIDF